MNKNLLIVIFAFLAIISKSQNTTVCFGLINTPTVTGSPNGITSGDFNRDGKMDMATCNGISNNVSVFMGDGFGNFTNAYTVPVGTNPFAIITADLNKDTILDLVVSNHDSNNFSVLLGLGTGAFATAANYATNTGPTAVTCVDFNKDGNLDLALSNDGGSLNVSIFYGNGNGTFGALTSKKIGAITHLIVAADFNNDTYPDIATVSGTTNNVCVKLGSFSGFDTSYVFYPVGTYPASLTFADFNNDGKIDIAAVNANSNNISILLGNGNGTFGTAINYSAGAGMSSIVAADLNGDSFVDIATADYTTNSISVFPGAGTGAFSTYKNFPSGNGPTTLSFADYNGDSKIDLSVTNYNANKAAVLLNSTFSVAITSTNTSICLGDTTTINATGGLTYSWSNGGTSSSIAVNPSSTTTYSLTGTNVDNCNITKTLTIIVNPKPVLTLNASDTTICSGNLSILTAAGASTYFWNTGDTLFKINARPTVTTTYTVTGSNAQGCSSSKVKTIYVTPSKTLSGAVTSTLGTSNGIMILYKYSSFLSKWDSIAFTPFSSNYSFGTVDSALYVIKAIPTDTTELVTYGASAISWKDATIIRHDCSVNTTQNISIIPLVNLGVGTGQFSGKIYSGNGFGKRTSGVAAPGSPIGGIIVKGGKNPGGQMFVQTTTAADGTYTLSGMPNNSGNDYYFILVDVPGLDTNGTYNKKITSGNTFTGLDFTIDSVFVNPQTFISVNDISAKEHAIKVFPNPASDDVTIQYSLKNDADVKMELFDIFGKCVRTIINRRETSIDSHTHSVSLKYLAAGMYFIKININGAESTVKLFVTD
ncbi:MAG: T9SS type A sorting domain-containing protein [Bacteroidota bacterium]